MKTVKNICISLLAAAALFGCSKHDFFDDMLIVGRIGPQVSWEPDGAMVRAGTSMGFSVQYFTTEERAGIERLEVWYDLFEAEEREVSSPWVPEFVFRSSRDEEVRVTQFIQRYDHDPNNKNEAIRAYFFRDEFPVSVALAPYNWDQPVEFSDSIMEIYFGDDFMGWFKDTLRTIMVFDHYREMLIGLERIDSVGFLKFTAATFVENTADSVFHFPGDSINPITGVTVRTVVPDEIAALYDGLSFADLVRLRPRDGVGYNVTYRQRFRINALMRVYDTRGVYGITETREIHIN